MESKRHPRRKTEEDAQYETTDDKKKDSIDNNTKWRKAFLNARAASHRSDRERIVNIMDTEQIDFLLLSEVHYNTNAKATHEHMGGYLFHFQQKQQKAKEESKPRHRNTRERKKQPDKEDRSKL